MWHYVIAWTAWLKPPAGPPWNVTDDESQCQTPATITSLAPYTMCRRASNKFRQHCEGLLQLNAHRVLLAADEAGMIFRASHFIYCFVFPSELWCWWLNDGKETQPIETHSTNSQRFCSATGVGGAPEGELIGLPGKTVIKWMRC